VETVFAISNTQSLSFLFRRGVPRSGLPLGADGATGKNTGLRVLYLHAGVSVPKAARRQIENEA
jgi:hypothetical protein